ncbi:MAG: hypothetical protein ACK58M_04335 [Acidobacteriota bacterium]|jgi:hypothetical protein
MLPTYYSSFSVSCLAHHNPVMSAQDDAIRDAHWAFFTDAGVN